MQLSRRRNRFLGQFSSSNSGSRSKYQRVLQQVNRFRQATGIFKLAGTRYRGFGWQNCRWAIIIGNRTGSQGRRYSALGQYLSRPIGVARPASNVAASDRAHFCRSRGQVHAISAEQQEQPPQEEEQCDNAIAMMNTTRCKAPSQMQEKKALAVRGRIEGVPVEHMLVDSGSVVTACSEDLAKKPESPDRRIKTDRPRFRFSQWLYHSCCGPFADEGPSSGTVRAAQSSSRQGTH